MGPITFAARASGGAANAFGESVFAKEKSGLRKHDKAGHDEQKPGDFHY